MAPQIKKRRLNDKIHRLDIISSLFSKDLDLILQTIFLCLDPVSLKHSRLVCRQWGDFIKRRVWGNEAGSKPNTGLRQRLAYQWRHAKPTVRSMDFSVSIGYDCSVMHCNNPIVYSVSCDNSLVVCGLKNGTARVYDMQNLELLADLNCGPLPRYELRRPQKDFESSVESDIGQDVVATATATGDVSVWGKTDWSNLYKGNPHGDKNVFAIKLFSNMIIAAADNGVLAILSWNGNKVSQVRMLNTLGEGPLSFGTEFGCFDSDGAWVVVGTDTKLNVWRFSDNALVHSIALPFVKSVALSYPFAIISKAFGEKGMSVWDLRTGQQVRKVGMDKRFWIQQYGSILAGSCLSNYANFQLFSLKEITHPELKEPIWNRRICVPGPGGDDFCINTSCLVTVHGNQLKVFDFWNSDEFSDNPDPRIITCDTDNNKQTNTDDDFDSDNDFSSDNDNDMSSDDNLDDDDE